MEDHGEKMLSLVEEFRRKESEEQGDVLNKITEIFEAHSEVCVERKWRRDSKCTLMCPLKDLGSKLVIVLPVLHSLSGSHQQVALSNLNNESVGTSSNQKGCPDLKDLVLPLAAYCVKPGVESHVLFQALKGAASCFQLQRAHYKDFALFCSTVILQFEGNNEDLKLVPVVLSSIFDKIDVFGKDTSFEEKLLKDLVEVEVSPSKKGWLLKLVADGAAKGRLFKAGSNSHELFGLMDILKSLFEYSLQRSNDEKKTLLLTLFTLFTTRIDFLNSMGPGCSLLEKFRQRCLLFARTDILDLPKEVHLNVHRARNVEQFIGELCGL